MSPRHAYEFSEKTKISLSFTMLVALLSAGLAMAGTAYAARDGVLTDMRATLTTQLKGYVSHEEFLQWQLTESEKRDRQFRELVGKLDQMHR